MDGLFDRVRDIVWPDFRVYDIENLKRYLLISLGLFVPLLIWYSVKALVLADATASWMALAYAPHIIGVIFSIIFVSVLGTRLGGCILEIYALVCFKLSFWSLFMGGNIVWPLMAGLMFWYSTNLARACFALANEHYNARW